MTNNAAMSARCWHEFLYKALQLTHTKILTNNSCCTKSTSFHRSDTCITTKGELVLCRGQHENTQPNLKCVSRKNRDATNINTFIA